MIMYMFVCMCKCMLPGTTIVNDCWGSNIRLGNEGLTDHTVKPCISFVDSPTGADTNMIEATWMQANFTSGLTEKSVLYQLG